MGLATLWVTLSHCWDLNFGHSHILQSLGLVDAATHIRDSGNAGVDIFLFLSGYGLFYSFSRHSDIRSFYSRRFYRILPPVLLVSVIFYGLTGSGQPLEYFFQIFHLSMFHPVFKRGLIWFAGLLIPFYLIYPLLHRVIVRFRTKGTLSLMALAVLLSFCLGAVNRPYFDKIEIALMRIPVFIAGIAVGERSQRNEPVPAWVMIGFCIATPIYFFCLPLLDVPEELVFLERYTYFPLAIDFCLSVSFIDKMIRDNPCRRLLAFYGTYSLEIYLLFEIVYHALRDSFLPESGIGLPFVIACFGITLVLAFILKKCTGIITKAMRPAHDPDSGVPTHFRLGVSLLLPFFLTLFLVGEAALLPPSVCRLTGRSAAAESIAADSAGDWLPVETQLLDSAYTGQSQQSVSGRSLRVSASPYEIYRFDGDASPDYNLFTALDRAGRVLAFSRDHSSGGNGCFICPVGTDSLVLTPARLPESEAGGISSRLLKRQFTHRMAILGDSISAFAGYIPEENLPYYDGTACGVASAMDMWWSGVSLASGYQISSVNAWSGSRVSVLGGTDAAMCMARTGVLGDSPDVILILGGINDFLEGTPLGRWNGTAPLPEFGETFREAYALMLSRIQRAYPLARICCCTLLPCERDLKPGGLERLHKQYLHEFNAAIREIASFFQCGVIDLNACGIHAYNLDIYMGDYNPEDHGGLHPNALGHRLMADAVLQVLPVLPD